MKMRENILGWSFNPNLQQFQDCSSGLTLEKVTLSTFSLSLYMYLYLSLSLSLSL